MVWIDWRGGTNKNWVWTTSGMFHGHVEENGVSIGQEKLLLNSAQSIRNGDLSRTLLRSFRWLVNFLPSKLRRINESKNLSRGIFYSRIKQVEGWSINEIVKWN